MDYHSRGNRICKSWDVQGKATSSAWLVGKGEMGRVKKSEGGKRGVKLRKTLKKLRVDHVETGTREPLKIYKGIFWGGRETGL